MNIKVELGEYIYKLNTLINSYAQLIQCITQKFQDLPQIFVLKYLDEDEDWICVQSEDDFQILEQFYKEQGKKCIKLRIQLQHNSFYLNTLLQNQQQSQYLNGINALQQQLQYMMLTQMSNPGNQLFHQNQQFLANQFKQENKGLDRQNLQNYTQNIQKENNKFFQQFNNEIFQNQLKSTVQPKNKQSFPQFPQQTNKPNNQSDVYSYHQQIKEYEIKKGGENIFNNDFTQQPENYQNFPLNLPQQQESVTVIKKEQNQDSKQQQKSEVQNQQVKSLTPQQREVVNWVKSKIQQSNIEVDCQECKNQSKEYFQCQKCQNKRKILLDPKLSDTIISNQILSHLPFFEKQYEENKESILKKENNDQFLKKESKIKEKKEDEENDTVKPENSFINLQSKTPNVNQDYVISSESQKFFKKFECSSCFNDIKDAKIKYVCQTCNENKQICEQCENNSKTCGHGLVKLKPEHENQLNNVQNKSFDNQIQDKKQELKYFSQFYSQTQVTKEPNEEKIHKLMKDEEQKIQQQQKSQNNENISEDVKELGNLLGSQILLNSQNSVNTSQKSRKNNLELMAKIELDSEIQPLKQNDKFYPILYLKNTGEATWDNVYLRCIEGTYNGGQQQVSQIVKPNQQVRVCLSLIAPKKAKEHVSFWRLYQLDKQKEKNFFGPRFQLTITVAKQNSTTSSQQLSQITPGQDGLQFSTNYQNN